MDHITSKFRRLAFVLTDGTVDDFDKAFKHISSLRCKKREYYASDHVLVIIITFPNPRCLSGVFKIANVKNATMINIKDVTEIIEQLDNPTHTEDDGYDGEELEWMSIEEKQAKEKERRRRKRLFKTLAKTPKEIDYDKSMSSPKAIRTITKVTTKRNITSISNHLSFGQFRMVLRYTIQ